MVSVVLGLMTAPPAVAAPAPDPVAVTTVDALEAELDFLIDGVGLGEPPVAPPLDALTEVPPPELVARWMALRAAEAVDRGRNPVDWIRTAQRLDPDLDLGPLAPSDLHPLRIDWEAIAVQPVLDGPRIQRPPGITVWIDGRRFLGDAAVGAGAHVVQREVDGALRTVVVDGPSGVAAVLVDTDQPCLVRVRGRCEARWFVGVSLGAGVMSGPLVDDGGTGGRTYGPHAAVDLTGHLGLALRLDDDGAWLGLGPIFRGEVGRAGEDPPLSVLGAQGRLRAGRFGAVLGGWADLIEARPGGHALASFWPIDEAPLALDAGVMARADGATGLRLQVSIQHPRFLR